MQGTTKSGFEFNITDDIRDDYEFIEKLRAADKNPLEIVDVLNYSLGPDQAAKLKEHCRDDNGRVSMIRIRNEFVEMLSSNAVTKK